MPPNSQAQLTSFSTPSDRTNSTVSNRTSTAESDSSPPNSANRTEKTPLDTFYEGVQDIFKDTYPDSLPSIDGITTPNPDRDVFVTSNLPTDLEAVPVKVGQWELDYHDEETVTYRASGRVYDERWGGGGTIVRHNVYLNSSGVNRDDSWHHRVELVAGFENPEQIRRAETSESDHLMGIRGYSPQNNDGDYGLSSGTEGRFDDVKTALTTLIAQLHTETTAIRTHLPDCEDTEWTLTSHDLRTAKYKREAPPSTEYDYLRLIAAADRVYLEGARTNDSAADRDHAPVPIPDSLPSEALTQVGNAIRVVATGVTPHLITPTIALPVDTLLESTALGESS